MGQKLERDDASLFSTHVCLLDHVKPKSYFHDGKTKVKTTSFVGGSLEFAKIRNQNLYVIIIAVFFRFALHHNKILSHHHPLPRIGTLIWQRTINLGSGEAGRRIINPLDVTCKKYRILRKNQSTKTRRKSSFAHRE